MLIGKGNIDPLTPNATLVQQIFSELEDVILKDFMAEGVHYSRLLYDTLLMPWDLPTPVKAFPKDKHIRIEWNRDGILEAGEADFFSASEVSLSQLGFMLGTSSAVTRWREVNGEKTGTDEDCVRLTLNKVAQAVGYKDEVEANNSKFKLKIGTAFVLLIFERVAE